MKQVQGQLALAAQHLQRGENRACQRICNQLLQQNPGLLAAFNLRGLAGAQTGDPIAAISDLSQVWPAQLQNTQAALWLGRLYRITGQYQQALPALHAAVAEKSLEIDARYELALVLTRLRRSTDAIAQYQVNLQLNPDHSNAAANLAFLLERANRLPEAEQMADRALQLDSQNFMAQLTKATLQRRNGAYAEAQSRLESALQSKRSSLNQSILLNQLAQCLLAQNQYPLAFQRFEQSNALLRAHHPYGVPVEDGSYGLQTIAGLQDWLLANPPAGWSAAQSAELATDPKASPIFLVGFPRSGTTLLDQALSAHPQIEVLEEFEFFDPIRRDWVDGDGLQKLAQMQPQELQKARQQYLDALQSRRQDSDKAYAVDKLPLNILYLFLIHRLFPDARILFMLRDPRDVCLSCFFQSFDLKGAMAYFLDLEQTARYYDAAMSLAHKSLAVISNPVFYQRYEKLVVDFEDSMREILGFLGLPWNEEILRYRQKALLRTIDTPSYQQVTRPLYLDSIGRWRHFSAQMEPLQGLLGPWVEHFDYPPS
jgi:tetratricopeptide (TPR) repeat protein